MSLEAERRRAGGGVGAGRGALTAMAVPLFEYRKVHASSLALDTRE